MDRRDAMPFSWLGSASYFTQRGMTDSGSGTQPSLHGSPGLRPSTYPNLPFQSNIGGTSTTVGSTLPQGVDVGARSAQPQNEPAKRKRGRPRRYGIEGTVSLGIPPSESAPPGTISPTQMPWGGRLLGSGRMQVQQLAALGGSDGNGFTLHIITVAAGEDIAGKIMSFSQRGPRGICIISANGAVSTVTLRQSCGTVTYEGRFQILDLSGSYLLNHNGGSRYRYGSLAVSLVSPDGLVFGGVIGGVFVAAITVQVTVASFVWGGSATEDEEGKDNEEEAPEGVRNLENQTFINPVTPIKTENLRR